MKTVCIHILYIYTLKKKNLILLALMVEGEKKSGSLKKKTKKLYRKKLTYDYIILLGLKWDVHIRLVCWTDRPWCEAVYTVAFVGCKTWQILSDEALGDTLHCPFLVVFVVNTCHSQLHILIDNGYHWTGQGSLYWQKIGQAFHYDAKSMALSEISFSLECIDCPTQRWICFWTLYTSCFDIELQGQGFSISIHLNM